MFYNWKQSLVMQLVIQITQHLEHFQIWTRINVTQIRWVKASEKKTLPLSFAVTI